MNSYRPIKKIADTYYQMVSCAALFITSVFSSALLYMVVKMGEDPYLAMRYHLLVPGIIKNILLVCVFVLAEGALFERLTR